LLCQAACSQLDT
jgi:Prp8 binding protein